MVTFSKPLTVDKPQGNSPQELKPIIPFERPQVRELTKGNYHMHKLHTVPYNANLPTHNLTIHFYNNRSVEKWLKFCKNLQAIIIRQNITNPQGSERTPIGTGLQENYGRHTYAHFPTTSLCYANQ
eukprot:5315528-Ditylum_brightwellii.AAC.1